MRFALLLLFAAGCGNNGGGGCPTTMRNQLVGDPCCPNFLDTACAMGLFCAALDSPTPTCQANHTRSDLTACTDDVQCASASCNLLSPTIGECRSAPGAACQASIGCAPVNGKMPICTGSPMMCQPIGNGSTGAVCGSNQDCSSRSCVMSRCLGDLGQPCGKNADCANMNCMGCGFTNVHCSVSTDQQECLQSCGSDGSGNTIYSRCVQEGGACNSFSDCAGSYQCSDCSAANNTCMTKGDLNECLGMCSSGGYSWTC
jgi:hypothetical protein